MANTSNGSMALCWSAPPSTAIKVISLQRFLVTGAMQDCSATALTGHPSCRATAGHLDLLAGDVFQSGASDILDPTPRPLDRIAVFVGLAVVILLMLMRGICRDDRRGAAEGHVHTQLLRFVAHVADQASVDGSWAASSWRR